MTAQHTPGPWATDLPEHEQPYQDIRIQAGARGICRLWIDDAPLHDYNAEQFANARLIAAAPDLLACLKSAVKSLEWAATVIGDIPPKSEFMDGLRESKTAIAKATGGEA